MTAPDLTGDLYDLMTQLGTGSPTAGDDCAALGIINVALDISDGKVGPKRQRDVKDWVRKVRIWGGAPLSLAEAKRRGRKNAGMLMRTEVLVAYRSHGMAEAFRDAGLRPPQASYYFEATWKAVPTALSRRWVVHLPVMYGVLRAGDAPTGSEKFRAGHTVVLSGYEQDRAGHVYTADGDSLLDGRYIPGPKPGRYPDGWQTVRLPDFQPAASAWTKERGETTFIAVRRG